MARLLGWRVYFTWTSLHSPPGFPDLVLCRPPRLLFVELKSEEGRLSRAQRDWLALLETIPGIEAYVWRPRDQREILTRLR